MPDLSYQKPDPDDPSMRRRRRAVQSVFVGSIIFVVSTAMFLSPIVIGRRDPARYLIAFGFVGACWGFSSVMHGAWDWWKGE
jgi:hypothetical protein